jgi:hypothetical protein
MEAIPDATASPPGLHGGLALLEHVVGGVHDAAKDIARHLEVEQVRPLSKA